ncbi:MAG TPA: universal stress protein [Vicinamibacterales bacterium]
MAGEGQMREILVQGGADEAFDRSVLFARRLAESFGARLHVVYTITDPLSAGWTAEMGAELLPDVHQAMEAEARERLERLIPMEDQDRLGIEIVLRTGPPAQEIVRYAVDRAIDLAIVVAAPNGGTGADVAQALLADAPCAVLALR